MLSVVCFLLIHNRVTFMASQSLSFCVSKPVPFCRSFVFTILTHLSIRPPVIKEPDFITKIQVCQPGMRRAKFPLTLDWVFRRFLLQLLLLRLLPSSPSASHPTFQTNKSSSSVFFNAGNFPGLNNAFATMWVSSYSLSSRGCGVN